MGLLRAGGGIYEKTFKVFRASAMVAGAAADALGVSRQTINAIETGKYDPSRRSAMQLRGSPDSRSRRCFFWMRKKRAGTREIDWHMAMAIFGT